MNNGDNNGNGGAPENQQELTPQGKVAARIMQMLKDDTHLIIDVASTLAWWNQHPGTGLFESIAEYHSRVDHLRGLGDEAADLYGYDAQDLILYVVRHFAKYMEEDAETLRFIVPGQPPVPEAGGVN